jgi:uncharacterized membrane protein
MSTTGLAVLVAGLALCVPRLRRGRPTDRIIAFGRVFEAAPLATFGGLHLAAAQGLSQMVPAWIPWHLFWAYLVGFAWLATALSLIYNRLVRWSGLLAGVMLLVFVATLSVPGAVATPHDRFVWAVLLRDTGFAAGLLALGASAGPLTPGWKRFVAVCRIEFAITTLFFGVQHFLHPEFAPAVPLERMTPAWIPEPRIWGYAMGTVLLVSGALILVNRWAREAAAWLGAAVALIVVVIYVPLLVPAHGTDELVDVINYIFDTLLFAGTALILGEAISATGDRKAAVETAPVSASRVPVRVADRPI